MKTHLKQAKELQQLKSAKEAYDQKVEKAKKAKEKKIQLAHKKEKKAKEQRKFTLLQELVTAKGKKKKEVQEELKNDHGIEFPAPRQRSGGAGKSSSRSAAASAGQKRKAEDGTGTGPVEKKSKTSSSGGSKKGGAGGKGAAAIKDAPIAKLFDINGRQIEMTDGGTSGPVPTRTAAGGIRGGAYLPGYSTDHPPPHGAWSAHQDLSYRHSSGQTLTSSTHDWGDQDGGLGNLKDGSVRWTVTGENFINPKRTDFNSQISFDEAVRQGLCVRQDKAPIKLDMVLSFGNPQGVVTPDDRVPVPIAHTWAARDDSVKRAAWFRYSRNVFGINMSGFPPSERGNVVFPVLVSATDSIVTPSVVTQLINVTAPFTANWQAPITVQDFVCFSGRKNLLDVPDVPEYFSIGRSSWNVVDQYTKRVRRVVYDGKWRVLESVSNSIIEQGLQAGAARYEQNVFATERKQTTVVPLVLQPALGTTSSTPISALTSTTTAGFPGTTDPLLEGRSFGFQAGLVTAVSPFWPANTQEDNFDLDDCAYMPQIVQNLETHHQWEIAAYEATQDNFMKIFGFVPGLQTGVSQLSSTTIERDATFQRVTDGDEHISQGHDIELGAQDRRRHKIHVDFHHGNVTTHYHPPQRARGDDDEEDEEEDCEDEVDRPLSTQASKAS